ncbi:spore coat polysaccharide biosynthesis protein SpsF [Mucilaginibacter oryzae]|uniref:Spore coat polysaccharide biosynthesis protein SpsF n=1 Tax=Mucilaginibacter oryzae TaxID=468058 RepID=A0A316H9Y6_9SPHI|nr:glycosyltransferase family protein [Mucilaginibacter oryzae]PWK74208.1 spore coat polysaccharide biosynthesis protein SpsF [Mucilaginibacter oryzae]
MVENVVIVVPARMASSRLYGKVMLPVLGKSLLARMIERLRMIQHQAEIVIATTEGAEDDVIVKEAESLDIPCYRGSLVNLLDRQYQAAKLFNAKVVVKIPADCPLIDPRIVDKALEYFFSERFDYVSNLQPATYPDGNDVEVMTMACLKQAWENAGRPNNLEHTSPFIYENPLIFNIGNITWETGLDYSMSHRFGIDYPEDYYFIERVFKELYPVCHRFSCQDIINLLKLKPNIYEINAQYNHVNWYNKHLTELKPVLA